MVDEENFTKGLDFHLEVLYNRRMEVKKLIAPCVSCGSEQIQLVSWMTKKCVMKCRRCKFKYVITTSI